VGSPQGATVSPLLANVYLHYVFDLWYVDTGRVRWRMVPFELGFRNSEEGARAARCAAEQGAFWEMHDALFLRRDDWAGERRPEGAFVELAAAIGIDVVRFEECYDEDRGKEGTEAANRAARRDGVRGTPTFFIDGFRVQGAVTLDAFVAVIERSGGV
jgi:protein-disulfide isomerase